MTKVFGEEYGTAGSIVNGSNTHGTRKVFVVSPPRIHDDVWVSFVFSAAEEVNEEKGGVMHTVELGDAAGINLNGAALLTAGLCTELHLLLEENYGERRVDWNIIPCREESDFIEVIYEQCPNQDMKNARDEFYESVAQDYLEDMNIAQG